MGGSKGNLKRIKKYNDDLEIKTLINRVVIELPKCGEIWRNPNIAENELSLGTRANSDKEKVDMGNIMSSDLFSDLPISRRTIEGLKSCGYYQMTLIQKCTLPHSLKGRDIIGQARTGSGKTLAYLIPVLENIYRGGFCSYDGILALVLTPTRELASQVFDLVKEIGKFHSSLSAGCIVGGKDIKSEATRINSLNIIIATPGRLIQHMDESPLWNANNLKILVIDEVDRMLDMGFSRDIDIILEGIPKPSSGRQTMVFSATFESAELNDLENNRTFFQVGNLEKCSLDVGVLPTLLRQFYMNVRIEEKVDTLFNFLRTHSNKKVLVFVSCCKQVRYFSTIFSKFKLGFKVLELHGKQSLQRRLEVVHKFYIHKTKTGGKNRGIKRNEKSEISKKKLGMKNTVDEGITLFCTDIASRGLDFPHIDWVVQLDIPDSVDTYIHRIGRTARYVSRGRSLVFVMPNEKYFLDEVINRGMNSLKKVESNSNEMRFTIHSTLQSFCASDPNIRVLAEKAFSAYVKSSFVLTPAKNREELKKLDFSALATSMGLVIPPKIKFNSIYEENSINKNLKYSTKLQRFKEKLRQRKLSKLASQQSSDNRTDSGENNLILDENSGVLQSKSYTASLSDEDTAMLDLRLADERTISRKLKFRSDSTGKIRGHRELEFIKKHLFFSDNDGTESDKSIESSKSDHDSRAEYIERIKSRLKSQTESDKNRDKERIHDMHVKKRRVLRERRKLDNSDKFCISDEDYFSEENLDDESEGENNIKLLASAALEKLGIEITK